VLVHDAARPLVSLSDIKRLTDAVYNSGAIGGLLAVPVQDTLKRAGEYGRIDATVSRERLWQAQTPQLFRAGQLYDALQTAVRAEADGSLGQPGSQNGTRGVTRRITRGITDESSAMENLGHSPLLVEALQPNLKVTRPADLRLAALLLKADESAPLDTSTS
jgi:2-C-methyl-D-erythritol 4-phosphate cytidylyltransferase